MIRLLRRLTHRREAAPTVAHPHAGRFLLTFILIASSHQMAMASGLESLEKFLRSAHSGRASFTQVVTAPARDGAASARSKTSSGSFAFERPGKFRFDYKKPFAQTLVADGKTLWLYDVDLNQVTARAQAQALASTPVALVAAAADLKALQGDFQLADAPDADGLQWVLATPRQRDTALQSVRLGLRVDAKGQVSLGALDMLDSFGKRSVLRFADFELNPALPASLFEFKPPAGADVIRP
ncbi:MAG: outer membrane lipoprotein chaperone LolA [Pseudomonadota bacterium]